MPSAKKKRAAAKPLEKPLPSKAEPDAIIIAVDFGTTYSGVAWHHTATGRTRHISEWPPNDATSVKVPTVLAYHATDLNQLYRWGNDIPNSSKWKELEWFKLLLNESYSSKEDLLQKMERGLQGYDGKQDLAHLKSTIEDIPEGKKPVDLVADYLRGVYQHTRKRLADAYPELKDDLAGHGVPLTFFLTVPAMWDDKAKDLTRTAAINAGMAEGGTQIRLISEPEAAAIHCLLDMKITEKSVKIDDVFVIVDCGGGTVDLVSYQVTAKEPRLKVKECTIGTGGLCGSTALNRRFEALVKRRIGQEAFDGMTRDHLRRMRKDFDLQIKPKFMPSDKTDQADKEEEEEEEEEEGEDDEEEPITCQLPGVANDEAKRVFDGLISFTREEMVEIFEPTFRGITALVQQQVTEAEENSRKEVTALTLVGGFGSSKYLTDWLRANVRSKSGSCVRIIKPENPQLAIVLGAVQHGVMMHSTGDTSEKGSCEGSMVQSRKARFHYGISVAEPFMRRIHPPHKMIIDPLLGLPMCVGRMQWFIHKGDDLYDGSPKKIDFYRTCPAINEPDKLIYDDRIYYSAAKTAPKDVEHTELLLTYKSDLSTAPRRGVFIKRRGIMGHDYWDIASSILMTYQSASLDFRSECGGKIIGEGKAEYHHDETHIRGTPWNCTCGKCHELWDGDYYEEREDDEISKLAEEILKCTCEHENIE